MGRLPEILVGLPNKGFLPTKFVETRDHAVIGSGKIFDVYFGYANWQITDDARNTFVCTALKKKLDYIFFMDSDMIFPKGCLGQMLRHREKLDVKSAVLGGVYCHKGDGRWHVYQWQEDLNMWKSMRFPLYKGLVEVDAVGTGCMLVDVSVFEKIPFPWFEYRYMELKNYKYERMSEDMVFCKKCKDSGIPVYADTDIFCGHINQSQIWPTPDGGYEVRTLAGESY